MSDIVENLFNAAKQCEHASRAFKEEPISTIWDKLIHACKELGEAWSKSCLGHHAYIYLEGFRPPQSGDFFDPEWGFRDSLSNRTCGGPWLEFSFEEVVSEIMNRAQVSDLSQLENAAIFAEQTFNKNKENIIPLLDALLTTYNDNSLKKLREDIENLKAYTTRNDLAKIMMPKGEFMTFDISSLINREPIQTPPHLSFIARIGELKSYGIQCEELARLIKRAARYVQEISKIEGSSIIGTGKKYSLDMVARPFGKILNTYCKIDCILNGTSSIGSQ